MSTYSGVNALLAQCLNSILNVKAVVAAFNQEKALVGAFSVITNLRMELLSSAVSRGGSGEGSTSLTTERWRRQDRVHCTVKHHTDIINFACMTWNFVRISASLSALCTNFERRKEKFNPRSPVSAPGDQSFRQIWFSFYAEKKLFVCRKNI